jgi:hypothetical protein
MFTVEGQKNWQRRIYMENFGPKKDFEKVKRNPITGVYTYEEKKKPSAVKPVLNKTFEE